MGINGPIPVGWRRVGAYGDPEPGGRRSAGLLIRTVPAYGTSRSFSPTKLVADALTRRAPNTVVPRTHIRGDCFPEESPRHQKRRGRTTPSTSPFRALPPTNWGGRCGQAGSPSARLTKRPESSPIRGDLAAADWGGAPDVAAARDRAQRATGLMIPKQPAASPPRCRPSLDERGLTGRRPTASPQYAIKPKSGFGKKQSGKEREKA